LVQQARSPIEKPDELVIGQRSFFVFTAREAKGRDQITQLVFRVSQACSLWLLTSQIFLGCRALGEGATAHGLFIRPRDQDIANFGTTDDPSRCIALHFDADTAAFRIH
jgi:hypothetical protein